jgi:catechol 2,3-dioxygenase-like lactoylglutathione lyase family enzyme
MLRLGHLNIKVSDLDRSANFYRQWFGFDHVLAEYRDGTRFVTDSSGFELGLQPRSGHVDPAGDWHFGFLASDASAVRDLMADMAFAGVPIAEPEDEPGYVGFKCHDPDGYMIEVYWDSA